MMGGLVCKHLQGLNAIRTGKLYSPHACRTDKMKRTEPAFGLALITKWRS
jgi:hypothetical protein